MKKLLKAEVAQKSTRATPENSCVECVHATVHPSLGKDERFQMAWSLNFENLSEQEIMEAAAEHFIIKIRRVFAKDSKPQDADWDNAQFDCKEFVTARMTRVEKAAKTLQDFSDEELAALGLTRASEKA